MKKENRTILNFQKSHTVVIRDDCFTFRLYSEDIKDKYDELYEVGAGILFKNTFKELCEDIFYSYYNKNLEIMPEEFVKLRFLLNNRIVSKLVNDKAHQERRKGIYSTIEQPTSSLYAFIITIEEILYKLEEYLSKSQKDLDKFVDDIKLYEIYQDEDDLNEDEDDLEEDEDDPIGDVDELDGDGYPTKPGGKGKKSGGNAGKPVGKGKKPGAYAVKLGDKVRKLDNDVEEKDKHYDELKKKIIEFLDSNENDINKAMAEGIKEAEELLENTDETLNDVLGGYQQGFDQGKLQKIPIHQRIELAKALSKQKKIKEIVEYLGRFRIISQKKQIEKESLAKIEPYDTARRKDYNKATPVEQAKFTSDSSIGIATKIQYLTGGIKTVEKEPIKEKENLGKGSVIICVDTSGSMSGIKEYKSKALAMAVAEIAYKHKRNFACVLFSSYRDTPIIVEIKPDEPLDIIAGNLITLAQSFYGGGTDFELPLEEAISIIEKDEFNNADILFLTDGFADVSEEFLSKYLTIKKEKQFKTVGLLLDASDSERNEGKKVLEKFCDEIKLNSSIEKDDQFRNSEAIAGDVFSSLLI